MTREMRVRLEDLLELVEEGEGCEEACAHCPFADRCGREELYWGCPCWEAGMGEDL